MKFISFLTFVLALNLVACGQVDTKTKAVKHSKSKEKKSLENLQTAYFASGCFWCVEAVFESVNGVEEVVSGYSGGQIENPTYEQVCTGSTGHAESVMVYYDSTVVSYKTLLKVFYGSHDPTTLNRQGPDAGTQYRSAIFYQNDRERDEAKAYISELLMNKTFPSITTEVSRLTVFYPAEDYHQNYEESHQDQPYVRSVSIPRLNNFKRAFPELLK